MVKMEVPQLAYDGGQIDVLMSNHDEAVRWFEKHMGFTPGMVMDGQNEPHSDAEKMTGLNWGTWIKSVQSKTQPIHLFADRGKGESNIRWCWRTRDLQEVHERFKNEGVKVSDRVTPVTKYFDFWATAEEIRLTAQWDPSLEEPGFFPSWTRMGCADLDRSLEWYRQFMNVKLLEDHRNDGFVIVGLALNHNPDDHSMWILEQLPPGASTEPINPHTRPYLYINDADAFERYYDDLKQSGITVSDIIGGRMRFFHFYDPDGNRFNIYTY